MDFGSALHALKYNRLKVAREGWNGKGMWLAFEEGVPRELGGPMRRYDLRPYIVMKTVDDEIVPWVASQTDLLAEDWVVV
jgi:hypothetical protein